MPTLARPDSGGRHDRWSESLFDKPNGQNDELVQSARDEQCESAATALFDGPNLLIRRSPSGVQVCPLQSIHAGTESLHVHPRPYKTEVVHPEWLPNLAPGEGLASRCAGETQSCRANGSLNRGLRTPLKRSLRGELPNDRRDDGGVGLMGIMTMPVQHADLSSVDCSRSELRCFTQFRRAL
jgi:hypothetical protein